MPKLVAADAGFYSRVNEDAVQQIGVEYISVLNQNMRREERKATKAAMVQERAEVTHWM